MFQSSKQRMRALIDQVADHVDDMLVGAPEPAAPHPHQRTVHLRIQRRAGMVAARPMHCLSPVRPVAERDRARAETVR